MTKKTIFSICGILIFLVFFILSGCQPKKETIAEKEAIPVKTIRVEFQTIKDTIDYAGDIKARDEAKVYPKVSGKIIKKVLDEGSSVKKGDVIVYIDRDEVGFKFEKAPVESPLTGTIGRVYVDLGTSVTVQTPVALVVDMDEVRVDLDIPEEYLPRISLGQLAEISLRAYPDEKFTGVVSKVSPVLDLETRTAPIEIIISNSDHRLKSGMFVQVQLILEERKNAAVIPKEAITGKEQQAYVYVVEGNAAHQKIIKTGVRQGAYFEVVDGLKEGDMVVVMGQQQLYEGALVSIGQ
ncbi:MAG: efflux RND transporter periplasmic adaptor subunit [Candidatus Omnitrophica bacterium]|nr:efflux RND transporter periplasmic adaptor subunit [Candidatus Omnitrophota bacterium]